jgi:hypothetical protein
MKMKGEHGNSTHIIIFGLDQPCRRAWSRRELVDFDNDNIRVFFKLFVGSHDVGLWCFVAGLFRSELASTRYSWNEI